MNTITVTAKTVEEAVTKALVELETTSDQLEYEVIDKGSTGFLGIGAKPVMIRAHKKETVADKAMDFLSKIFEAMGLEVSITSAYNEEEQELSINLEGDDMGILIGKRGQTLDSLQYLASLIVNKDTEGYLRVKLDTENYRERRKDTLETLAKNISYKVKRTKRPVSLEPMNPYERRIIHAALQNDRYVTTRSEGEEPFRHVVVALKKDGSYGGDRRTGRGRYGSGGSRYGSGYGSRQGGYRKGGSSYGRYSYEEPVQEEKAPETPEPTTENGAAGSEE